MLPSKWTSAPRVFPTSGFDLFGLSSKIEEETLSMYSPEKYYPVQQGELFNSRYQALAKLGYGVTSTVWFPRDLVESTYVVLKIYILGQEREHELNIYNHIDSVKTDHPGRRFIRKLFDQLFVEGPKGRHVCLVHEPLGINATELLRHIPGRTMTLEDMKPAIRQLLVVLDFLPSVARTIHTVPTARKVLKDRTIYITSQFPAGDGLPLLSDFGEARFGDEEHNEDILPDLYRASEVILKSNWDYKVDIWSVAMLTWDIVSPHAIIQGETKDGIFDDRAHVTELVALLGAPPPESMEKRHLSWVFWDESGNWKNLYPIPDRTLEKPAADVQGGDVEGFL